MQRKFDLSNKCILPAEKIDFLDKMVFQKISFDHIIFDRISDDENNFHIGR